MHFNGRKYQLDAVAEATHRSRLVGFISSMGTTVPNSPLDKLGYGQILFHELNLETDISESRRHDDVIEKPFGLTMAEGGQKELFVGHDVLMSVLPNSITWADVARLCEWRFFHAQACALTCAPRLLPQQENTKCSTKRGFCWQCSGGLLLPDRCAFGWDDNILAQWVGTDNEHAVLLTYPPDASDFRWERPNEGPWEIPHLCGAKFEGPRIVRNCRAKAALNFDGPTLSVLGG